MYIYIYITSAEAAAARAEEAKKMEEMKRPGHCNILVPVAYL